MTTGGPERVLKSPLAVAAPIPPRNLDRWLTANAIDGDFTDLDTALLERERGFATLYTDGLNRYAAVKGRPKTLSAEFIDDLFEVTGDGRTRDFETAAITRSSAFCAAKASATPNCSAW